MMLPTMVSQLVHALDRVGYRLLSLFLGLCVVRGVHGNEVQAQHNGDEGTSC